MMFVPIICVWCSLSKIWIWFQYFFTTTCMTENLNTKFKKRWLWEINIANDETGSVLQNTVHLMFCV